MTEITKLDVRGLGCPVPILRANRVIKELIPGDTLEVLATDSDAPHDFKMFCETTGHKLLESFDRDGIFTIRIEVTS